MPCVWAIGGGEGERDGRGEGGGVWPRAEVVWGRHVVWGGAFGRCGGNTHSIVYT